ncbi:MAG TPA: cytochrome c3 family protein [Vicinamibacteria bacterium]
MAGALVCAAFAVAGPVQRNLTAPADFEHTAYTQSATCLRCHPARHASWQRTFHRTMTQPAGPAAVVGDFGDARYTFDGVESRFQRQGDRYFIETLGPGGQPGRFEVAMTVGSRRFQQYVTRVGDRHLRLPLAWNIEEKRWFHLNGGFLTPDGTDFSSHLALWDGNCIFCHNVKARPGYDWASARYASQVEQLGIACEACHAPAAEHVARNANPLRRYLLRLGDKPDPTIVNPRRLDAARRTQVCGHCHGQRLPRPLDRIRQLMSEGDPYVPGQDLSQYTEPLFRESQLRGVDVALRFWKDGTPRLTAYEYQGVLLSRGHERSELSCLSCHEAHGGDPKGMIEPEMRGPKGCVQCHPAIGRDVAAHTRHQAEGSGSDCYACHMPRIVYGLLETHPSHRIQSPDPARAWRHDMPEACTLCHLDRSVSWAAREWSRMFAQPLPADLPAAADPAFGLPESVRALAGGDVVQRAVALRAFSFERSSTGDARARLWAVPWILMGLEDDYAAVRHFAWRSLRELLARPGALAPGEAARWGEQPGFDPQAPAPERQAAVASYRTFWRALDKRGLPADAAALGLDAAYEVPRPRLAPLLARRDTRLVSIGE